MEKIGEYIIPLLIVLSFVYSFVKKAGKKIAEEEAGKTTLPEGIPNDDIPKLQIKPKLQQVVSKSLEKKINDTQKVTQPHIVVEEVVEEGFTLDFSNIDELKKGIVFAEIFNKKY